MSSLEGDTPIVCASWIVTGIMTATSGVLLVKAEAAATTTATPQITSTL